MSDPCRRVFQVRLLGGQKLNVSIRAQGYSNPHQESRHAHILQVCTAQIRDTRILRLRLDACWTNDEEDGRAYTMVGVSPFSIGIYMVELNGIEPSTS